MSIRIDVSVASIAKEREEVCGDTTEVIKTPDATTVIISDGLGSGIKASILSILTTKIAGGLLRRNVSLDQVFETIAATLPICRERRIAYSTLSILKISYDGSAHLIEYDNPPLILIRQGLPVTLPRRHKIIAGKRVLEATFKVDVDDLLVLVSDGVINAGVGGGLYKLGLGTDGLIHNIAERALDQQEADLVADKIIDLARACYLLRPGDDTTAVVVKPRKPRQVTVLTGPPHSRELDEKVVADFLAVDEAEKIVCGGATAQIVARESGRSIKPSLCYEDPSVPPTAEIEGIDLVTEGILTLNKCVEKIQSYISEKRDGVAALSQSKDGASMLAHKLLRADRVAFWVGTGQNPAHQELMQSLQLKTRQQAVGRLVELLRELGKEVSLKEL